MNIAFRGQVFPPMIEDSPLLNEHLPAFTEGVDSISEAIRVDMTTTGRVIIGYDDNDTPAINDDTYDGVFFKMNENPPEGAHRSIPVEGAKTADIINFVKKLGADAVAALPYGPQVAFSGSTEQANPFKF